MIQELKTLDINIQTIIIDQKFGYQKTYMKREFIKHKKKQINSVWYDTKKSDLIYYSNNYNHINDFNVTFIYRDKDGTFFRRVFTPMGEEFNLTPKQFVLGLINDQRTLF